MAAVILISIIYLFLYELRTSFKGRLSKKILGNLRIMVLLALLVLILMYSAICYIEFNTISELNSFLGDKPQSQDELTQK
jgi:hypothetical protein